jgi:hypothetical protein
MGTESSPVTRTNILFCILLAAIMAIPTRRVKDIRNDNRYEAVRVPRLGPRLSNGSREDAKWRAAAVSGAFHSSRGLWN